MNYKYIVASDHPYYPSVEYFYDLESAQEYMRAEKERMQNPDGTQVCTLTIARIQATTTFKSAF